MTFDIFTLMAASSAVVVILGIAIFLSWIRDRSASWMAWWGSAYTILALANVVVMARPAIPESISAALGSAMLIVGFSLIWQAARVFEGRKPYFLPFNLAVIAWIGFYFFTDLKNDLALRVAVTSVPMAAGLLLPALELWRGRAEQLPSRLAAICVLVFLGSVFCIRAVIAPYAPYPMGGLPVDGLWVAGFNGVIILSAILLTLFLISMSLERLELGQRRLARSDPLTGLANRRALEEQFERGMVPTHTAMLVFDLDRFKLINDVYGHAAGDELLRRFTRVCRENIRQVDIAARIGGEEFVVILSDSDARLALEVAERIRRRFADLVVVTDAGEITCTVSCGAAVAAASGEDFVALLRRADRELYRAKHNGRNRVCIDLGTGDARELHASSLAARLDRREKEYARA